jgi:hypothetical protein
MGRGGGSLLQFIEDVKWGKDECLVGLHDLAVHDHLVEDVMCLFDVVHDVQLADVLEVFVHGLHQVVDELQIGHFVLNGGESTSSSRSRPMMK